MSGPYSDHADFYERGPYSCFLTERRVQGSAPIGMFMAEQPNGAYPDPALPNMLLYVARRGVREARFDWGAGRWRGRWHTGDLTLVPPDSASDVSLSDRHAFLGICLPAAILDERFAGCGTTAEKALRPLFAAPFRDPLVTELASALWGAGCGPGDALFADHAALCLLSRLSVLAAEKPPTETAAGLPRVLLRRVRDYVEENLERPIAVLELSALCDLSASHFTRAFRAATGVTPYRYVLSRRLERARGLLEDGVSSIAETACMTGFSSQSHLTEAFRARYGITPGRLGRESVGRSAGPRRHHTDPVPGARPTDAEPNARRPRHEHASTTPLGTCNTGGQ